MRKNLGEKPQPKIILASSSSWRKEILGQIGLCDFEVVPSDFEEDMAAKRDPYELAKFLALGKAKAVAKDFPKAIVIGADTFVVHEGRFLGKPKDLREAQEVLAGLSGREHLIITGLAVVNTATGEEVLDYGEAWVRFRDLTPKEIAAYARTEEPLGKAGSYAIMGKGNALIESIKGDFYSIVGLPANKVFQILEKMGVRVWR